MDQIDEIIMGWGTSYKCDLVLSSENNDNTNYTLTLSKPTNYKPVSLS